jgi:hypothetical protein
MPLYIVDENGKQQVMCPFQGGRSAEVQHMSSGWWHPWISGEKRPSIRLNTVDKLNGVQYIDVSWALRNEKSGMRVRCGCAY